MTPDGESIRRIIYRSAQSGSLGPEWDVIEIILQQEDHGAMRTAASILLARNPDGAIMRGSGTLPERWEQVTGDDALRACQEFFDERDRLATQSRGSEGDPLIM